MPSETKVESRLLENISLTLDNIDIRDFIEILVEEPGDDDLNRSIYEYALKNVTSNSLEFGITFQESADISKYIREPDNLQFKFIESRLITDAETFEQFNDEFYLYE